MIHAQIVEELYDLLQSGQYATKKAAIDEIVERHEHLLTGYASEHSFRMRLCEMLRKAHPETAVVKKDRPGPIAAYSQEEIFAAADQEIIAENVRYQKQLQGQRDRNRIAAKSFREHARVENALEAYGRELVKALNEYGDQLFSFEVRGGPLNAEAPVIVVHLSDVHANELIDLPTNTYDFEVMAKRLEKLAAFVRLQGEAFGVERVVLCFGGDMMNSDRRLDELLHMATNRARATMLAVHLLVQFIADLRQDFFLDIFGVTGNEGRAKQELGFGDVAVTDNYDAQIYYILQELMEGLGDHGLRFHRLAGNERVFKVHGETFMLVHGHQVRCQDQKAVQAMIGKKAAQGVQVTHVLAGHIHASLVSDYVSRNSSMAGSNAYSEEGLQFVSKAAQNCHVVTTDSLYGMKVDLQNTGDLEGYEIISQLEAYNAKSVGKLYRATHSAEPIVVVI